MSFSISLLRVRCACSLPATSGFWPRIEGGAALGAATIVQSVGLLVYLFSWVWFDRILSLVEFFPWNLRDNFTNLSAL
jgi:hypothetical protein